jgi:hypothetical protein
MAGIDTAAMEGLLTDLLKEAKTQGKEQTAMFIRLAKAAGLDPKIIKQAEDRLKLLGDAAEETAKEQSKLGKAGSVVGNVLADLAGGILSTAGNLANFAASTLSGKAKMSDMVAAFKDLPIVGTVANLFAGIIKLQEENMSMYRSLSSSGINFGDSISSLRTDFLSMGLTSESYTKIMKENADIFAMMGGSVSQGAKNFKAINKELVNNSGGLLELGYGYEELSSLTASYARVMGGLTKQQQEDTRGTTKAVIEYGKELDLLSRLTGRERAALQKKLEDEQAEANWQAFLTTLPKEARDKLKSLMAQVEATTGEAGVQILKAQAQGISVQGEAGQLMTSLASNTSKIIREQTDNALNGQITVQQYTQNSARRLGEMQHSAATEFQNIQPVLGALQLQGSSVASQMAPLAKNFSIVNEQTDKTIEGTIARITTEEAAAKADAARRDSEKQAALEAERAIRELSEQLSKALNPVIRELVIPALKWLTENTDWLTGKIKEAIPHIKDFINNIFTPEGRTKIMNDLGKLLSDLVSGAWNKFKNPEVDLKQDEKNWEKMNWWQKGVSGTARGIENVGGWLGMDTLSNRARADRVESETEYLKKRSFGTWGNTGGPFENFGNGTMTELHGIQGVFKPEDIQAIMSGAAANNMNDAFIQLNNTNMQMLQAMKDVVEYSRKNVEATQNMGNNAFA